MMSSYYYYCNTCSQELDEHCSGYLSAEDLIELWRVRNPISELADRVNGDIFKDWRLPEWIKKHRDHDVQINTTNSCGLCAEIPQDDRVPTPERVELRQLITKDGCRGKIVECEPGVPRTVDTICERRWLSAASMGEASTEVCYEPKARRYAYKMDAPAIIRIYEEV